MDQPQRLSEKAPYEERDVEHVEFGDKIDREMATIDPYEKAALRKFDWILMPCLSILIIVAWLDRTNIGNAYTFGLGEGLRLKGTQFNDISTMFFPLYIILDIPWVVAIKRFGVKHVLAFSMLGVTGATIGMAFTQNYSEAIGCRLVLGAFEAGLLPAGVFIISTIWDQNSQAKRIAVIYISTAIAGAFGGLIAYGTQVGGDKHGLESWRWLFIIEGALSGGVALIAWPLLPRNAEKARFLSSGERAAMEARAQRAAAYKGEDQSFRWAYFKLALGDPFVLVAALTLFAHSVAVLGMAIFLPTIISGLGFEQIQVNYLTVPVYVLSSIVIAIVSYLSDRFQRRLPVLLMLVVPSVLGYAIILGTGNKVAGYVALYLAVGSMPSFSVVLLTWISINISPEYKRSIALPFILTITNCSGLVGSQIYVSRDSPRYIMGNAVSMSCEIAALIGIGVMFLILWRRNNAKAKLRSEGVDSNGKEGDKALHFVYLY